MANWTGAIMAVLVATVTYVSSQAIVSEGLDEIVQPGGEVTLPCKAEGKGYAPFMNPIIWTKVVGDQRIEINNNGHLKSPFIETGRHSINIEKLDGPENNELSLALTISGVEAVDNGIYECELYEGSPKKVVHQIIVPEDVQNVEFYTNNTDVLADKTVYRFKELEPAFVMCESTGGNPKPQLHIHRGKTEITNEFQMSEREIRTGELGLERVSHVIRLEDPAFRASWEHTGERLKCVAKIHKGTKQTVTGVMDVQYQPKFECEESHFIRIPIDIPDYAISCVIKANPQVAAGDISWTIPDTAGTVNITSGESRGVFTANSTMTEEGFLNVSLTISGINTTHFSTYHLRARNGIREEHLEIYLGEATTTTTTTTTTQAPPRDVPAVGGGPYNVDTNAAAPTYWQSAKYLPLFSFLHVVFVFITSSR